MNPRFTFGAAGLLAIAVLTAGGVAFAASPSPTSTATSSASSPTPQTSGQDIVLPAGGPLAERVTAFCRRSDEVVARLTERQTKIGARDPKAVAAARARTEKRVTKLRDRDRGGRADAIERRVDRRTKRVGNLPERLSTVKAAAQECDSLGLS